MTQLPAPSEHLPEAVHQAASSSQETIASSAIPHADAAASPALEHAHIIRTRMELSSFAGPIPPPDMLRAYEQAVPGSALKILAMAESTVGHIQRMQQQEAADAKSESDNEYAVMQRGQTCAVIITGMAFTAGAVMVVFGGGLGASIVSAVIAGGTLFTLITSFLYNKHTAKKEDAQKK